MNDESEGLKSRIKVKDVLHEKINGKESNTANGVNIATEFNEYKNLCSTRR